MPTSKRELALAAALVKLQAITGITGLVAERNRRDSVAAFPMLVMRDGSHAINGEAISYDLMTITLELEIYVAPTPAQNYGTLVNAIWAAAKVALLADQSLAGTAFEVREAGMSAPDVDGTDTSTVTASAIATFEIDVWHARNDPYT